MIPPYSALNLGSQKPARSQKPSTPLQLLAIDLDGTLLRSDRALSKRTAEAVSRAVDHGVRVVLASARPPRSVRLIYSYLKLDTLQVNYNGALIHDQTRGRHVFHRPITPPLTRRLVCLARRIDPGVVVSLEVLDRWYTDHVDKSLPTETSKHFTPDFVGSLDAFLDCPVTKVMLLAPPRRIKLIRKIIQDQLGPFIAVTTSDKHMIQILHPRVDKSAALAKIAKHYGIDRQAVMAIGDAPNDVGMLRWAGVGVAVQNAWPEARLAADQIVPSNDDNGVAHAIQRYVLPTHDTPTPPRHAGVRPNPSV